MQFICEDLFQGLSKNCMLMERMNANGFEYILKEKVDELFLDEG